MSSTSASENAVIDDRIVDSLPGFDPHIGERVATMYNTRDALVAHLH
jgi:hypothetical protein